MIKILLDTANIMDIEKYIGIYEVAGVTTNPTIIFKEQTSFFPLLYKIQKLLGDRQLHVQVTGGTCREMVKEAECIRERLGKAVYIKVPVNEEGIRTIRELKQQGFRVTATAVYTTQQAMLAAAMGADYVAPYFNRMNNLNIDSKRMIEDMGTLFLKHEMQTGILAASFKNTQQVMDSFMAGAAAVTVPVSILTDMVSNAVIDSAIRGFQESWTGMYGEKRIYEL